MKESQSLFIDVRGLKYHCRAWGDTGAPSLFMLHGYQDVSASWQLTVDALQRDWYVIAPDWRGYGLTFVSPVSMGFEESRNCWSQITAPVLWVEGAGHNIHHDQPEALAALIEGYV